MPIWFFPALLALCAVIALAAGIAPLLGPATPVVFALNGIPWWYAQDLPARVVAEADVFEGDARTMGSQREGTVPVLHVLALVQQAEQARTEIGRTEVPR